MPIHTLPQPYEPPPTPPRAPLLWQFVCRAHAHAYADACTRLGAGGALETLGAHTGLEFVGLPHDERDLPGARARAAVLALAAGELRCAHCGEPMLPTIVRPATAREAAAPAGAVPSFWAAQTKPAAAPPVAATTAARAALLPDHLRHLLGVLREQTPLVLHGARARDDPHRAASGPGRSSSTPRRSGSRRAAFPKPVPRGNERNTSRSSSTPCAPSWARAPRSEKPSPTRSRRGSRSAPPTPHRRPPQ